MGGVCAVEAGEGVGCCWLFGCGLGRAKVRVEPSSAMDGLAVEGY